MEIVFNKEDKKGSEIDERISCLISLYTQHSLNCIEPGMAVPGYQNAKLKLSTKMTYFGNSVQLHQFKRLFHSIYYPQCNAPIHNKYMI